MQQIRTQPSGQGETERVLTLDINAGEVREWKPLAGAAGIPCPLPEYPEFADMRPLWKEAGVKLVRSYDWMSRLDTRNNPASLFPNWDADPADPASYNFEVTDQWVEAVHSSGADVLFTFASAIPSTTSPALDVGTYGLVVEHVVRHYALGWADGPARPVRMFEFGDQPDFGNLHFSGSPDEFFAMYEAFCTAVKRVDDGLLAGGPSLAFPLNSKAPYREGLLSFVRERQLPLDFFSFLWFTDTTRDPLDYRFVAQEIRTLLDSYGLTETKLMLSYWNYLGIPTNEALSNEKAAFQAAAAIYMQETLLDYALVFRADTGIDAHYNFKDPAAIFGAVGVPDEQTAAFTMTGKVMSGQRLAVSGGDEAGFACIASIDDDRVRVLISNFVAPASALAPRTSDEFRFRIPLGSERVELGFMLPPQRTDLASAGVESAHVRLRNLPWMGEQVSVTQQTLHGEPRTIGHEGLSASGCLDLKLEIGQQSVVLIELVAH